MAAEHQPSSSLGNASDKILELEIGGNNFLWLRRHGADSAIAPHRINYRANIQALSELGATEIIAVNTVGGISGGCQSGCFVVADQIMDLSWGRDSSFFDGEYLPLQHIDFTHPFDQELRSNLLSCAGLLSMNAIDGGTYACTQGPRLETAAEIKALESLGADIVGMTVMPEAALARELDIAYASICPVINRAAGLSDRLLVEAEIRAQAGHMMGSVVELIRRLVETG